MRPTGRGLRFSAPALAAAGAAAAEVRRTAARELARAGKEFVAGTWTWEQLREAARSAPAAGGADEQLLRLEAASFDAERTPDVVLTPKPYHLLGASTGTGHGTPYDYDREIPLIFLGPGFPHRQDGRPAASVDILPTVLDRLGIDVPEGLDGSVLEPGGE
jgi:hypothetical protein